MISSEIENDPGLMLMDNSDEGGYRDDVGDATTRDACVCDISSEEILYSKNISHKNGQCVEGHSSFLSNPHSPSKGGRSRS